MSPSEAIPVAWLKRQGAAYYASACAKGTRDDPHEYALMYIEAWRRYGGEDLDGIECSACGGVWLHSLDEVDGRCPDCYGPRRSHQ